MKNGELAHIAPWLKFLGGLTAVYLGVALHRLYHQSWMATLMKTLLLIFMLAFIELSIGLSGTILTAVRLGF